MTAARRNHAPVSIPAGSFDRETLGKGLDDAAAAAPEDRAAKVTEAVAAAAGEGGLSTPDGSIRPDQKLIERTHPELGIVERVRVRDPDSEAAKEMAERAEEDAARLDRQAQARADRISEPDVDPVDVHAGDPKPDAADKGDDKEGGAGARRGK